ncbi:MAG TPA: hypothetical protein VF184_00705 [Phycisphaeraceae bacterium]
MTARAIKILPPHATVKKIYCRTDGLENRGRVHSRERAFDPIRHRQDIYAGNFSIWGANQDVIPTVADHALTYDAMPDACPRQQRCAERDVCDESG